MQHSKACISQCERRRHMKENAQDQQTCLNDLVRAHVRQPERLLLWKKLIRANNNFIITKADNHEIVSLPFNLGSGSG